MSYHICQMVALNDCQGANDYWRVKDTVLEMILRQRCKLKTTVFALYKRCNNSSRCVYLTYFSNRIRGRNRCFCAGNVWKWVLIWNCYAIAYILISIQSKVKNSTVTNPGELLKNFNISGCVLNISYNIRRLWCPNQVSQAWIRNCTPQCSGGCNYLSIHEIPASWNKILVCR